MATLPLPAAGTGAGTTERELKNGLWTNKNAIVLYNNSVASSSIAANQATYLGTLYCTANGQTGMAFKPTAASGGSAPILGLYNAYNQVSVSSLCRDNAANYTYNSATWRLANGNVGNRISWVDGGQDSWVTFQNTHVVFSNAASGIAAIGVSLDSTTNAPELDGSGGSTALTLIYMMTASVTQIFAPQLGFSYGQRMEVAPTGTVNFACAETTPTRQGNSCTLTLMM